jgi:putative hydrolase of the HAD superfamily
MNWVIFDLDQTLIQTHDLYSKAQQALAKMIHQEKGVGIQEVLAKQDEFDVTKYGYQMERFVDSFILTARHFKSEKVDAGIALNVFDSKAQEFPNADYVVRTILSKGFNAAIITAGDKRVQRKRFDDLSFINLFHDLWIVDKKDVSVYIDFINKHHLDDPSRSWMIGDSIKSDMIPAYSAGLRTIHVNNPNWATMEAGQLPTGTHRVSKIEDILGVIR